MFKLITDGLSLGFPPVVRMALGLLLTPLILNVLGQDAFGVWKLCFSIMSMSWLFQFGLNSFVNLELPAALARKDFDHVKAVVSTVFITYCIAAFIVLFLGVLFASFSTQLLNIPNNLIHETRKSFLVVSLAYFFFTPLSVFGSVLSGYQKYKVISAINTLSQIICFLILYFLLQFEISLFVFCGVASLQFLVPAICNYFASAAIGDNVKFSWSKVSFSLFKKALPYSINGMLFNICSTILLNLGLWLSGSLLVLADTAKYSIALQVCGLIPTLIVMMLVVLKPEVSKLQAGQNYKRIQRVLLEAVKFTIVASLFFSAYVFFYYEPIINIWLGSSDHFVSKSILLVVLIGKISWVFIQANYFVLNGMGLHKTLALWMLFSLISCLLLVFYLSKIVELDLLAISMLVNFPYVVVAILFMPKYVARKISLDAKKQITSFVVLPIKILTPHFILLFVSSNYFYNDLVIFLFLNLATIVISVSLGWFLLFPENVRSEAMLNFRNIFNAK